MQNAAKKVETFFSGGPGTTGREPFEDSTATGPGAAYDSRGAATGTTGVPAGTGTGPEANARVAAGMGAGHHPETTPSGQYGSISNIGGDGHHHAVHDHHSHRNQGHIAGAGAAAGAGAGLAATAAHRDATGEGPTTTATGAQGGNATDAATRAAASQGQSADSGFDRTGTLGQKSHLYESTGASGPISEGAAGTDRFDAKEPTAPGVGAGGAGYAGYDEQEATKRAEGKSSGGIAGVLGTSDKDFTGRDRLGAGAYVDDKGVFSDNTHGPGGKSALTGREGDISKNPVAQAKGMVDEARTGVAGTGAAAGAGTTAGTGAGAGGAGLSSSTSKTSTGSEKKKGFISKVKDALS